MRAFALSATITGVEDNVASLYVAALSARMTGVEDNVACLYVAAFACSNVGQSKRSSCKRSAGKRGRAELKRGFNHNAGDL